MQHSLDPRREGTHTWFHLVYFLVAAFGAFFHTALRLLRCFCRKLGFPNRKRPTSLETLTKKIHSRSLGHTKDATHGLWEHSRGNRNIQGRQCTALTALHGEQDSKRWGLSSEEFHSPLQGKQVWGKNKKLTHFISTIRKQKINTSAWMRKLLLKWGLHAGSRVYVNSSECEIFRCQFCCPSPSSF